MTAKHRTHQKFVLMVKDLVKDHSGRDRTLFLDQQLGGYLAGRHYRLTVFDDSSLPNRKKNRE